MAGYESTYAATYPASATGTGNNLPVVPVFTAGSPSIIALNNLSYAVSFLIDQDIRPTWHFFKAATLSILASTWTTITYNQTAFDSDAVQVYPGAVITTQGRYALEACVNVQAGTTKDEFVAAFLFTAGTNNPHYATGVTHYFGHRGSSLSQTGSAVADNAMCLSDVAPMALYPGDTIDVQVFLNAARTLDFNQNTSYIQGRFVTNFSGYWVGTAS